MNIIYISFIVVSRWNHVIALYIISIKYFCLVKHWWWQWLWLWFLLLLRLRFRWFGLIQPKWWLNKFSSKLFHSEHSKFPKVCIYSLDSMRPNYSTFFNCSFSSFFEWFLLFSACVNTWHHLVNWNCGNSLKMH